MTIRQHLSLIPATLALSLSLLATATAQSDGTQEPGCSETITCQAQLENHLQAILAHYQELENQLSKATTQAGAKDIWNMIHREMGNELQNSSFIRDDLQGIPFKEQKRILEPYREKMQSIDSKLSIQLKRLGFDKRSIAYYMDQIDPIHSFIEAWESLVYQYPEESDADELFQQYLARLDNHDKLLSSIRTPNDRQRVEETIDTIRILHDELQEKKITRLRPNHFNRIKNDDWTNELQDLLQKLPPETQKRLYDKYLPLTQPFLHLPSGKASGQYHYLVYQSEPLLQYLSRRYQEQYMLQKAQENITEQKQDNFPVGMPEKEILIRQNIALTNQLSNLLSEITGKAAAAAAGPHAYDLKNRLLENRELLICSDDVSPEEQTRIDRAYGEHMQQATDKLNRQVQRLASKKTYRNNDLSDIVAELSPEQKPQQQNNATPVADQTEKAQPETDEN